MGLSCLTLVDWTSGKMTTGICPSYFQDVDQFRKPQGYSLALKQSTP